MAARSAHGARRAITRMRLLPVSEMKILPEPSRAQYIPAGEPRLALLAGPPSPENA